MAKRNLLPLILILLLFPFSLTGRKSQNIVESPKVGGVLRVKPFSSGPFRPDLDPLGGASIFLIDQLYDGLVRLDNRLNVIPDLAEYWTISDDGKKVVFYLRKGIKFHHGQELSAEDVKFSLERIVATESPQPYSQYFTSKVVGALEYHQGEAEEVKGFKVLGPHTFAIEWKNPYVSGLYLLSMAFCKILPRELVLAQGKNFFYRPSGTGPFKFAYWLRSPRLDIVGVRLERNEDYFGKKPYLEAIEFSPYFTLEHFLDDEVHIIPYISERLSGPGCRVVETESFLTAFLLMSCHLPPLNRVSVRRAVSLAIDKKELARAAFRLDMIPQVTYNFIPARLPGFFPADDQDLYDPVEARRILFDEGFAEPDDFPTFWLFFRRPRREEDAKIFRVLREQMAALGIKLKMKHYQSFSELRDWREPYFVFQEERLDFPDAENLILPLFASTGSINLEVMRYSSQLLDELLKKAETERSRTERIALFQRIEKILNEEVPAVPLFSPQPRLAIKPYVRGVQMPTLGFYFLNMQEIWLDQ